FSDSAIKLDNCSSGGIKPNFPYGSILGCTTTTSDGLICSSYVLYCTNETAMGRTIVAVSAAVSFTVLKASIFCNFCQTRKKIKILMIQIHIVPPKTPVTLYHCTS